MNDYVVFETASPLKQGNAVIVVKDASNNVLWSWHIWICNGYSPIDLAQTYYNNAGVMMDRNLGATSATPGDVGSGGSWWSCTPSGYTAYTLSLTSYGSVNPLSSLSRASGLSVRCLQE